MKKLKIPTLEQVICAEELQDPRVSINVDVDRIEFVTDDLTFAALKSSVDLRLPTDRVS